MEKTIEKLMDNVFKHPIISIVVIDAISCGIARIIIACKGQKEEFK